MQRAMHVAILNADATRAAPIEAYLSDHGFEVTQVGSCYRLDRLLGERGADLVILDDEMPDADPLALARRLSARNRMGILMLAGGADCLTRICCLEAGADDCLAKPAELREVLARVKAILRRSARAQGFDKDLQARDGVKFGRYRFDAAARRMTAADGSPIAMTDMEVRLLCVFAQYPNRAMSRDELVQLAYGRQWSPFDRSLDIRISRLRQKLECDPARPEVIATVRGIGYRYEARG